MSGKTDDSGLERDTFHFFYLLPSCLNSRDKHSDNTNNRLKEVEI